jgi:hypothetical protein
MDRFAVIADVHGNPIPGVAPAPGMILLREHVASFDRF